MQHFQCVCICGNKGHCEEYELYGLCKHNAPTPALKFKQVDIYLFFFLMDAICCGVGQVCLESNYIWITVIVCASCTLRCWWWPWGGSRACSLKMSDTLISYLRLRAGSRAAQPGRGESPGTPSHQNHKIKDDKESARERALMSFRGEGSLWERLNTQLLEALWDQWLKHQGIKA